MTIILVCVCRARTTNCLRQSVSVRTEVNTKNNMWHELDTVYISRNIITDQSFIDKVCQYTRELMRHKWTKKTNYSTAKILDKILNHHLSKIDPELLYEITSLSSQVGSVSFS